MPKLGILTDSITWHSRLGHPDFKTLQMLKPKYKFPIKGLVNKNVICKPRQLGKGKCLPFSLSSIQSHVHFEFIHSDLWCSLVVSLSG